MTISILLMAFATQSVQAKFQIHDPEVLLHKQATCQLSVVRFVDVPKNATAIPVGEVKLTRLYNCTGVVVDKHTVLTAAHCVEVVKELQATTEQLVAVGTFCNHGADRYFSNLDSITINPKWISNSQSVLNDANDQAIVRVASAINVTPIKLEPRRDVQEAIRIGRCVGIGFGASNALDPSVEPRVVPLYKLSSSDVDTFASTESTQFVNHPDLLFLGFRHYLVHGDSGGPLFCINNTRHYVLVGVASRIHDLQFDLGPSVEAGEKVKIVTVDGEFTAGETMHFSEVASVLPMYDLITGN